MTHWIFVLFFCISLPLAAQADRFGQHQRHGSQEQGAGPDISSLQQRFNGRVVGMHRQGGTYEVQILTAQNRMILVTVDGNNGAILQVRE